jgi:endonuclease/exonuclease/phosphatase family metal-dependent hydrolase
MLVVMVLPWMMSAPAEQVLEIHPVAAATGRASRHHDRLRVATWNLAHGRGTGFHQALLAEPVIRDKLDEIARVLIREHVDLAALQEVDGRSWWNGGLDMARHLAHSGGFAELTRGDQVATWGLHYGSALLTTGGLADARAVAFPPSAFAPGKGFTFARWWAGEGRVATVATLHFHFAPGGRQRREAELLIDVLRDAPRPLIVCGDFNAGWRSGRGLPARVAEALGLEAWQPQDRTPTLVGRRSRIDWILVSAPLRIVEQRTLPDILSDHRGVIAEIEWPRDEAQAEIETRHALP